MSDIVEPGGPEFRTDNINTLGQFLKVATHIEKRAFPKQVILPKAGFFQECYRRVFLGGGNPSIEHMALVGVNDVGEILLGKEVFDGTEHFALSDKSKQAYYDLESLSRKNIFPPGWKTVGNIHSHPYTEFLNTVEIHSTKLMGNGNELNNLPWSFGDFLVFLHEVKYRDFQTQLLINSSHIGFMVASKEAYKLLQNPPLLLEIISKKLVGHAHRRGIIESMKYIMGLKKSGNIIGVMRRRIYPPARIFDEIGIITYSARHLGHFGKDLILKQD